MMLVSLSSAFLRRLGDCVKSVGTGPLISASPSNMMVLTGQLSMICVAALSAFSCVLLLMTLAGAGRVCSCKRNGVLLGS